MIRNPVIHQLRPATVNDLPPATEDGLVIFLVDSTSGPLPAYSSNGDWIPVGSEVTPVSNLEDGSVTTPKLADRAVIGLKLALGSVGTEHHAPGGVDGNAIATRVVAPGHLALGSANSYLVTDAGGVPAWTAIPDPVQEVSWIHPADHGAAPGNSASANVTGLQAALNLSGTSYRPVVLEPGVYEINSPLVLPSHATMVGAERLASTIRLANGSDCVMIQTPASPGSALTTLWNLRLDGNRSNQTKDSSGGLLYTHTETYADTFALNNFGLGDPRHRVFEVLIQDVAGHGLEYHGRGEAQIARLNIHGTTGHGIYWNGLDSWITDVSLGSIGKVGVYQAGGGSCRWTSVKAWFVGTDTAYTDGDGWYIGSGVVNNTYVNCHTQDTHRHGWYIQGHTLDFTACSAETSGSLYREHGQGNPTTTTSRHFWFSGANQVTWRGVVSDRFGTGSGPYATNMVRFTSSGTGPVVLDVTVEEAAYGLPYSSDAVAQHTGTDGRGLKVIQNGEVILGDGFTATELGDALGGVNTKWKTPGLQVWDETNGRPLWAGGSAATDPWVDATGTTAITPA